jgi:hypothetical protein
VYDVGERLAAHVRLNGNELFLLIGRTLERAALAALDAAG